MSPNARLTGGRAYMASGAFDDCPKPFSSDESRLNVPDALMGGEDGAVILMGGEGGAAPLRGGDEGVPAESGGDGSDAAFGSGTCCT